MASLWKRIVEPIGRWWESKRDQHFAILQVTTLLSLAMIIWSVIFFAFMGGATAEGGESLRDWTWIGLVIAMVIGIWAGPEYLHYGQNLTILNEVLELDSRSEVMRRRKEAEEAAKLLGKPHQARLLERYSELKIRTGRLFDLSPSERAAASEGDEFLSQWWNAESSRLAASLPSIEALRQPAVHKALLLGSLFGLLTMLWNAVSGIARESVGGARTHSIDLTAIVIGADQTSYAAPHLDVISGILMLGLAVILAMTRPADEAALAAIAEATDSSATDSEE